MMSFPPKTCWQIFACAILSAALLLPAPPAFAQREATARTEAGTTPYGLRALFDGSGFVRIAPGEFLMGSNRGNDDERPAHRVRLTHGFEIGKYEVTQAQWEAVMESRREGGAHGRPEKAAEPAAASAPEGAPKESNPSYFKGPQLPVENVSWDEVQQFLRALNALDGKHLYRLPTEAEWEYAARAGSTKEYAGELEAAVWYQANAAGHTQPVGQKRPNAWGLYDMYGNVFEWVEDWYDLYQVSPAVNPPGGQPGAYRVYRGCSWYSASAECRASFRSFDLPASRYYSLGFRLVRTAK